MSFAAIVGHRGAIDILKGALATDRLAHAYLFSGQDGIGKRLVALNFAKAVNCLDIRGDGEPCDNCISCRKIESQNHPDVFVVEPEGRFIKIGQVRELQRRLQLKAVEGRYKVCIMDGADCLNPASANALLKTLEEPAERTILILIAISMNSIPATVLSRCQKIRFSPVGLEEIIPWLEETTGVDRETARLMAIFGGGSIARSLSIKTGFLKDIRREVIGVFDSIVSGDITEAFEWAERVSKRDDIGWYIEALKIWIRDLLVYKNPDTRRVIINQDVLDELEGVAGKVSLSQLFGFWENLRVCERALFYNANKQVALEHIFLNTTLR